MSGTFEIVYIGTESLAKERLSLPDELKGREDIVLIGAEGRNGELLGTAAFGYERRMLFLYYLYVEPEERNRGIGSALLREVLLAAGRDRQTGLLVCFPADEESKTLWDFFSGRPNFFLEKKCVALRVTPEDMKHSAAWNRLYVRKCRVTPYRDLSLRSRNRFIMELSSAGIHSFDEVTGDMPLADDLCLCVEDEDRVRAGVFFRRTDEKVLHLTLIYGSETRYILDVLADAALELSVSYPDYGLLISTENHTAEIIEKLAFPEGLPGEELYMAHWNGLTEEETLKVLSERG